MQSWIKIPPGRGEGADDVRNGPRLPWLLYAGRRRRTGTFSFSLLFVGYSVEHPLSRDDRMDLYKHEYAHYMQAHMKIPEKYQWQTGKHGSAWKYCCSLVGAAPTPYYKAGEALMNHDYDKVLKSKIHDHTVPMRDHYRREQEYKKTRDSKVQYQVGDSVEHPKFGAGSIEKVEQRAVVSICISGLRMEYERWMQKWVLQIHPVIGKQVTDDETENG